MYYMYAFTYAATGEPKLEKFEIQTFKIIALTFLAN